MPYATPIFRGGSYVDQRITPDPVDDTSVLMSPHLQVSPIWVKYRHVGFIYLEFDPQSLSNDNTIP
jgi:hypothetical protein